MVAVGTPGAVQTGAVSSPPACPSSAGQPAVFSAASGRGQSRRGSSERGSPGSSGTGPAPLTTAKTLSKLNGGFSKQSGAGSSARGTSGALYKHLHLRCHRPLGQTKAQAFHFLLLLPTLRNKAKHWSAPGFLFLWRPSCHAIAPQGHYQSIYSSANNRASAALEVRAVEESLQR